jgi:hypothetical protein
MKKLTIREKNLAGIAYQDSKGGVTLGLITITSTQHWDLVPANPLDAMRPRKWFQAMDNTEDEITMKYFNVCLSLHLPPNKTHQNGFFR